jgi:L-ascorbate metabolism protein UlaG (beta-lactamase superfamily)
VSDSNARGFVMGPIYSSAGRVWHDWPGMSGSQRTLERIKELDHLHRNRVRSAWQSGAALAASLHFLRAAVRQLARPTVAVRPLRVPRPAAGLSVTFVGHATAMLTSPESRVLTDPLLTNFLMGLRRAEAACLHPEDAAEVSLVLISHAHHDHLHRPSLRQLPRAATIVVPPRCADLVERMGFARVVVLEPGEELVHRDLTITAVAARHDGARGLSRWRGAGGYVVRTGAVTLYFAGDTAYFSGFEEIGRLLNPRIALLPISGYEPLAMRASHMSPLDALYAFEDLGAEVLIPISHGSFPLGYEPIEEPLHWLEELAHDRRLRDRLMPLRHGETASFAARE